MYLVCGYVVFSQVSKDEGDNSDGKNTTQKAKRSQRKTSTSTRSGTDPKRIKKNGTDWQS